MVLILARLKTSKYLTCILIALLGCQGIEPTLSLEGHTNIEWNPFELETEWSISWYKSLNFSQETYDGQPYYQIKQGLLLRNSLDATLTLERDKNYIIETNVIMVDDGDYEFGLRVNQYGKEIGYCYVKNVEKGELIKFGTKFRSRDETVEIRLGFNNRGLASALVQNITIHETTDVPDVFNHSYANTLYKSLGLTEFDSLNYHKNVLLLAEYINSMLITPLVTYYNYVGTNKEKQDILAREDSLKMINAIIVNAALTKGYFTEFIKLPVTEMSKSYCVKTSLSSYDVLGIFNIPTRQIHFVNPTTDIAFHQFFEYWHPYLQKWIIVDPYYGICYADPAGNLLGFNEIKEYASKAMIDQTFLKHENLQPFYFNLQELSLGWNDKIFRGQALDYNRVSWAF